MEQWKQIEGFSNYEISNTGKVRNLTTKYVLKGRLSKSGYLQVSIKNDETKTFKNQYIHRLVAIYFIPNPENKREVNHINGDKTVNEVSNLEWVTPSENQLHKQHALGKKKTSQRKVGRFSKEGELLQQYNSILEAAKTFGKSRVNIDNALQKKQKTAYGFIWEYLD